MPDFLMLRALALSWLLLLGCAATPAAFAQSSTTITPAQRALLQSLTPAQRNAMLRRFQGSTSAAQGNNTPAPAPADATPAATGPAPDDDMPVRTTLGPDSTVIVLVTGPQSDDRKDDDERKATINARNPYVLDRNGALRMPGIAPVSLAGLTEEQALIRLRAEPALAGLEIEFFLLPLDDLEQPDLQPFGYDLFAMDADRFAANDKQPVPTDYVIGPGDTVNVQFYGAVTAEYSIAVDRDGTLGLPELGPLPAAGLTFDALREEIKLRVSEKLIGSQASVTLGELRSIRVFLLGDVEMPGAYQVSAFSTMTNVLALGRGIAPTGSLRSIQQKRNGRVINTLDLYSLLLQGDASRDRRLANGDVVFVPTVGPRITVSGDVQRPAIYEYKKSISARQAVTLAGGSLPSALISNVRIERPNPASGLDVFEVDLRDVTSGDFTLQAGDRLVVPGDVEQLDNVVTLSGHVRRAGLRPWRPGLRLSDVLDSDRDVGPDADTHYVVIKRQRLPNGPISVISASIFDVWRGARDATDPALIARDEIIVFSMDEGRSVLLDPILETLRQQSSVDAPSAIVSIDGEVKAPGFYPLEADMTVADLIRAGGGLTEAAYADDAELRRHSTAPDGARKSQLVSISLQSENPASSEQTIALQPYDRLNIKRTPNWGEERFIEIRGEVTFPGRFSLSDGESLASVLDRAGGLTPASFAGGAVLTRASLRERERQQLDELATRIENDLATLALSNPDQEDGLSTGQSLLRQLRSAQPTGRLVIDMDAIVNGESKQDLLLRDGDLLFIPKKSQEVTVIGEVQYATSHLWNEDFSREDYILRSGGITPKADKRRIYVVRASGEVVVSKRSRFYGSLNSNEIRAGDTIVVPIKTDRVAPVVLWTSATQIIYNLAIAAAAVNSF